jgi:beta-glucanase (GH16 family)
MLKPSLVFVFIFFASIARAQNPIEKEGWELTFNDEFNAKALDDSVWQDHYYWGGRSNKDGVNYYGKEQFQFSDSSLIIVAEKKKAPNGMDYVSGMIDSHNSFKQQYGYFEIRSKNPKGTGFWPAFWLVSTEDWPPEIDVFEFYTSSPNLMCTNQHWKNKREKRRMQPKDVKMEVAASEGFHTYAVEWTESKISWFCDGEKVKTSRRGMKYLTYEMHIIINNEISDFKDMILEDAVFPNYFEIDYVRVYQRKEL